MEFRNLKKQYEVLKNGIDDAALTVFKNANFISGGEVAAFEKSIAAYVGVKYCLACANGTDAITLALKAFGIGEGDAVFVPDFTFFATAEAVAFEGAVPIMVDVETDTFNMCAESLENAIKKVLEAGGLAPKAIIPVDLFGLPANYEKIEEVADRFGLKIIEDAAQGFGGALNGKKACGFGHISTTSFFPAKPLGCYGDGGAVFTDDEQLYLKMKSLAVHGKDGEDKYNNKLIGMNSRLDTVQAAILSVKLRAFDDYELENINKVAAYYTEQLQDIVCTPVIQEGYYSSFAQYTLKLENEEQRNGLADYLRGKGIPTMVYYPKTMSEQTALKPYAQYQVEQCENAVKLTKIALSLPIDPYKQQEELDMVVGAIKEFLKQQ